ncbi:MAG TPA: 2-oxo-4-hydroxy-4-carboxy-5-ureidoimidazoline decarboxylase [Thermoanaerobaculia bacterium]|nr:2-oxo-4-hydroxy-4-carboxy-5-ureidoimidazoline decarboxylase [Thermoanaerobaculia bacterium]
MSRSAERFNALSEEEAIAELLACCASRRWARRMAAARPLADREAALRMADAIWRALSPQDWLEAFAGHARIGERASGTAGEEQAGTRSASRQTLESLARANRDYEERFGHIFIVCATGKSAGEMLDLCRGRLHNDPERELEVAAEEQRQITRLRLERIFA